MSSTAANDSPGIQVQAQPVWLSPHNPLSPFSPLLNLMVEWLTQSKTRFDQDSAHLILTVPEKHYKFPNQLKVLNLKFTSLKGRISSQVLISLKTRLIRSLGPYPLPLWLFIWFTWGLSFLGASILLHLLKRNDLWSLACKVTRGLPNLFWPSLSLVYNDNVVTSWFMYKSST